MSSTNFQSGTVIASTWLNDVNGVTYNKTFPDGTVALSAAPGTTLDAQFVSYEQGTLASGAVTRTVQNKLQESVSVKDFGAKGDGTTNDANAINNAISYVNSQNGGTVYFPTGKYNIGSTQITIYPSIRLIGSATGGGGQAGNPGTTILYSGAGTSGTPLYAIKGTNLKDTCIENIALSGSGNAYTNGIYLQGAWLCTIKNVEVGGFTAANGFGILIDTHQGAWGAQHNYIEKSECSDGIVAFIGTSGSDEVTTTVVNTFRGYMYQAYNCQVTFINATAEGFPSIGFDFQYANQSVMINCDLEGSGTTAISIASASSVMAFGNTFAGFTGTNRYVGNLSSYTTYGGGLQITKEGLSSGNNFPFLTFGNQAATYVGYGATLNSSTGGAQDGSPLIQRSISGTITSVWEFKNGLRIEYYKTIATTATSFFTLNTNSVNGGSIKVTASGLDTAGNSFSVYKEAVYSNNFGTMLISTGNALTTTGTTDSFTFTSSGASLIIQFAAAGSSGSIGVNFVIQVDGIFTNYTLN